MDNYINVVNDLSDRLRVPNIALNKPIIGVALARHLTMDIKRMALDSLSVERFEVVDDANIVTVFEEGLGEMTADKSSPSRHENLHTGFFED